MTYGFVKTYFERPEILVFSSRVNTFASHLKIISMRKLFILMMAFLLPVSALEMRAEYTTESGDVYSGETDSLQVQNDLDRYVMKELEILDKNNLFWGYHLQEGYEKRVELCRYAPKESSPKRKAQKEVWKDLIEQVVQEVVG